MTLDVDIALFNYRPFSDAHPARFRFADGFTALLGINNAGKSSLLRFFYEFRPLFAQLSDQSQIGVLADILSGRRGLGSGPVLLPGERPWHTENERPMRLEVTVRDSIAGAFGDQDDPLTLRLTIPRDGSRATAMIVHNGQALAQHASWITVSHATFASGQALSAGQLVLDFAPLAAAFMAFSGCMYAGSFRNVITAGSANYYDLNIGDAFIANYAELRSGNDPAANEAVNVAVSEIARIFGYNQLEVNAAPDARSLQLMVDGRSRRTSEVGAGFTQFLMLIVNVLVKKPTFLLIDEPETGLHATLQLDFLTALGRGCSHGILFSTHSTGLAHAAADRIYTVQREGLSSQVNLYESAPALPQLLGQLGYEGTPAFGFRRVLLVEGVTEVRTLQQWLRLFRLEHEVLLIPMGGGNLIKAGSAPELFELTRMGVPTHALIDSEKASAEDPLAAGRAAFASEAEELGIQVHVLERRATENYLTDSAVKAELGPTAAALGHYEKLKDAQEPWGKRSNWRIASRMTIADLEATDLGRFIADLVDLSTR